MNIHAMCQSLLENKVSFAPSNINNFKQTVKQLDVVIFLGWCSVVIFLWSDTYILQKSIFKSKKFCYHINTMMPCSPKLLMQSCQVTWQQQLLVIRWICQTDLTWFDLVMLSPMYGSVSIISVLFACNAPKTVVACECKHCLPRLI